jgi:hypothetical protein
MARLRTRAALDLLAGLRRLLLLTLMAGTVGMGIELLFIGHVEDRLQLVPIVLLPAGPIALAWHTLRPSRASATPVVAPGSIAMLGLVGLAAVHGFSSGPQSGSGVIEEDAS